MSTQITTAFVQQYSGAVHTLAQQRGSRLARAVRMEPVTGKVAYFDRIGAVTAQKRTTRHGDTPQMDTPHSRRRVSMADYEWADLIDDEDKVRTLIDPAGHYVRAGAWAMGRAMDDVIIEAANGTAYTGEDGSGTQALPAAQQVAKSVGTTTGMNLEKLIAAREILDASEIDPETPRYLAVTREQISDLLKLEKLTSADYAAVKALVAGHIDTFMGFNFIRTERLNVDAGNDRLCLAWSEPSIILAVGISPKARMSERDDKGYSMQVYYSQTIGGTRLEDEGVVEIECAEPSA